MSSSNRWLKWLNTLCARGFRISAAEDKESLSEIDVNESKVVQNDVNNYVLNISGPTAVGFRRCVLKLSLPKFDKNGVFEINGVTRSIVQSIRHDYSNILSAEKEYVVDNWVKVLKFNLSGIISNALENFCNNGVIPPENVLQDKVDNFLKTDYMCQLIKNTDVAKESVPETIYFKDIVPDGLDVDARQFPDKLRGLVDYASTGAGDNINKSYRLVKGTVIDSKGRLQKNKEGNDYCSTIQNNVVGIEYNPNRVHLLRAQYEQALPVENNEIPYIRAEHNMLEGMHLNTAVMNLGHKTYEDAIVFSESAAARFKAIRTHYVRLNTSNKVDLRVSVGNTVSANTPVLEEVDSDNKIRYKYCENLTVNGIVADVNVYQSRSYGRDTKKTVVEIHESVALMPGDKITTRGGIKGVAVVCPDNKMPHVMSNEELVPIDVCISIKSVYNRRSVVTLWEMAANRYVIDNKIDDLISKPFNEPVTYEYLMDNGYGQMTQLYMKGKELPNKTYVNPLFFLRNEKIASDQLSYNGDKQMVTLNGTPVNNSRLSGQKFSLANKENIEFKGFYNISSALSAKAKGRMHVMNIINALKNNNE